MPALKKENTAIWGRIKLNNDLITVKNLQSKYRNEKIRAFKVKWDEFLPVKRSELDKQEIELNANI